MLKSPILPILNKQLPNPSVNGLGRESNHYAFLALAPVLLLFEFEYKSPPVTRPITAATISAIAHHEVSHEGSFPLEPTTWPVMGLGLVGTTF